MLLIALDVADEVLSEPFSRYAMEPWTEPTTPLEQRLSVMIFVGRIPTGIVVATASVAVSITDTAFPWSPKHTPRGRSRRLLRRSAD